VTSDGAWMSRIQFSARLSNVKPHNCEKKRSSRKNLDFDWQEIIYCD
jgi:hypothetical protein